MSWRDRDYNQMRFSGGGNYRNPLLNILFGSVPLGTWFGTRVRVHNSLVIWWCFDFVSAFGRGSAGLRMALVANVILFGVILLHEFGHCIASRMVGGHADEILLWLFGGLASTQEPHRPGARFWAVAGGPLMNVLICLITGAGLIFLTGMPRTIPWNPFLIFSDQHLFQNSSFNTAYQFYSTYYLWWIYSTSYTLLVFNLIPVFPLDGGQIVQTILWKFLGYYKSMNISCIIGMIGGGVMIALGLVSNLLLAFLGVIGIITCYQMRQAVLAAGPESWSDGGDYSGSYNDPPKHRRRKLTSRWFNWAKRRAAAEAAEQAKIDAILAKVHDKGLHSLTWWEKRTLRKATERQRQRDMAERL